MAVPLQVMSPNRELPEGFVGQQGPQQQQPLHATQERFREVRPDGTVWEAQRVNIT